MTELASLTTATAIVPATTANLGPGFDCLGAALAMYNQVRFTRLSQAEPPLILKVEGTEADRVATDASNLVYTSFVKLCEITGQAVPPVQIEITLGVPLARGLGSSATAIAAGLVGANFLLGNPLSPQQIVQVGVALEGHPDNIVPALLGGCRLSAQRDDAWAAAEIPWNSAVKVAIAIPNFELSTAEARRVLPETYSRADAIFNVSHLGLLLRGLENGRRDWLTFALQDRIHQPYRQALIPGFDEVRQAGMAAGAYEVVISGAGPTLLALGDQESIGAIAAAMKAAWERVGIAATALPISLDLQGTRLRQE